MPEDLSPRQINEIRRHLGMDYDVLHLHRYYYDWDKPKGKICFGMTTKGERCQKVADKGSHYCRHHHWQVTKRSETEKSIRETEDTYKTQYELCMKALDRIADEDSKFRASLVAQTTLDKVARNWDRVGKRKLMSKPSNKHRRAVRL